MKVLLIDDEEELVSALAERLSFRGIDADWVTNGDDALRKLNETFYDIAVVDVKMPKTDGIKLKGMMAKEYPKMKFIFMTGHGSEADFKRGSEEVGQEYYLCKPVDIEDLTRKLHEVLKQ